MLTEEQQKQFIAFVVNFARVMRAETTVNYEQAEIMVQLAASVLLGALFHILPPEDDEKVDPFIMGTMEAALKREFGATVKVMD